MRNSSLLALLGFVLSSSPALAAVRCQLAYTPTGRGAQPVLSLPRAFEAVPPGPGRSAVVFNGEDGIITRAVATIQPNQAAEGRLPGTSALTFTVLLNNTASFFGVGGTVDSSQFLNYTGKRARLLVINVPPKKEQDFLTPTTVPPPGTPSPAPVATTKITPLVFTGPSTDFGAREAALLQDKVIVRVELVCAEGI